MSFEVIQSEILLKGRAFTIRRDTLKTPDERETKFDIIEHHGSVVILPIDAQGNLLFVRQYRHATGGDLLELPAGTLDSREEAPEHCAAREIREETGFAAGKLIRLGEFYLAPGYSTEFMVVFLATELHYDPLQADADEFISLEAVPLQEALKRAETGGVPDAKSLAALFIARPALEKWL
jgi:ADP-ribose pyrophosphatase